MSEDETTVETTAPAPGQETDGENDVTRLTRALEHEREERRQAKEELRLLREDEEAQRKFLAELGYEIDDQQPNEGEDDDEGYEDEESQTDPRLDRFEQFMTEQQQAQQQQALTQQWAGWAEFVSNEAKEAGVELAPHEIKALSVDCRDNDGFPVAPEKARKVLKSYLDEARAPWIEALTASKPKPRVPHTPAGGQPPGEGKDPADMTRSERQQYMLDRLRAEQA